MLADSLKKWLGLDDLASTLWTKIQPWADKKVDELVDKYLPILIERLLATFPTLVASVAKVVIEKAFGAAPGLPNISLPAIPELAGEVIDTVVEGDPDWGPFSDVIDLSEMFRKWREGRS